MNPIPTNSIASQSTSERSRLVSFADPAETAFDQGKAVKFGPINCMPSLNIGSPFTSIKSTFSSLPRLKDIVRKKFAPTPAWASLGKARSDDKLFAYVKSWQREAKTLRYIVNQRMKLDKNTIGDISKITLGSPAYLQNPFDTAQDSTGIKVTNAIRERNEDTSPRALSVIHDHLPNLGCFYRDTTFLLRNYLQMSHTIAQGEIADKSLTHHHKTGESRDEIIEETLSTHAKLEHILRQSLDTLSLKPADAKLACLAIAIGEAAPSMTTSTRDLRELKGERELTTMADVLAELTLQSKQLHARLESANPINRGLHLSQSAPIMQQRPTPEVN